MDLEKLEAAYNRLSMLHSETMLENIELRKRLDIMSSCWWTAFKHWVKTKLGRNRYD